MKQTTSWSGTYQNRSCWG